MLLVKILFASVASISMATALAQPSGVYYIMKNVNTGQAMCTYGLNSPDWKAQSGPYEDQNCTVLKAPPTTGSNNLPANPLDLYKKGK
jgi:hypothetical protein